MPRPIPAFVFAKPPVPGVSKTRLARGLGAVAAAELAHAFLLDTVTALAAHPALEPVIATTDVAFDFGIAVRAVDQGDGDLGARLERVLREGISSAGAALAVGADSPGMPSQLLVDAVAGLDDADAVLVPSADGGFVVLAVRKLPGGVLAGIRWSAPETRTEVVAALVREGLSVRCLEGWFDVDEPDDLARFRREVDPVDAPNTWDTLRRHGADPSFSG